MNRFVVVSQPSTYVTKEEAIRAAKVGAAGDPGVTFYVAELQVELRAELTMREYQLLPANAFPPIDPKLIVAGEPDANGNIWPIEALEALAFEQSSLYRIEGNALKQSDILLEGAAHDAVALAKQAAYSLQRRRDSSVRIAPALHADDPASAESESPETADIPF